MKHIPLYEDDDFVNKLENSGSFKDAFDSGKEAQKRNHDSDDVRSFFIELFFFFFSF